MVSVSIYGNAAKKTVSSEVQMPGRSGVFHLDANTEIMHCKAKNNNKSIC